MSFLKFAVVLASLLCGHASSATCPSSFNINYPPTRTLLCPGDNITYTCTFNTSNTGFITTQWSGSGFQCPATNKITLTQASTGPLSTTPVPCGNLSAVMTNISTITGSGAQCYTSVLTIPTPQYYNGTTVQCVDTSLNTVGSGTLNVQLAAPPSAPTITSLTSTYSDQLAVTWTSVPTATSYSVSINSSSSTPVTITSSGPLQNTFTGLTNNTDYTVSVVAINCAGNSISATLTNRTSNGPATPITSTPPVVQPSTTSPSASQQPAVASTNTPQPTVAPTPSGNTATVTIGMSFAAMMVLTLLALA